MDWNFDHQMSPSKRKYLYYNIYLLFSKHSVPSQQYIINLSLIIEGTNKKVAQLILLLKSIGKNIFDIYAEKAEKQLF
jgi:hypothetical protein